MSSRGTGSKSVPSSSKDSALTTDPVTFRTSTPWKNLPTSVASPNFPCAHPDEELFNIFVGRQHIEGPYRPFHLLRAHSQIESSRRTAGGFLDLQPKVGRRIEYVPTAGKSWLRFGFDIFKAEAN